jgi:hypothetical protein
MPLLGMFQLLCVLGTYLKSAVFSVRLRDMQLREKLRIAAIVVLILVPTVVFARQKPNKQRESVVVEVVSSKTKTHVSHAWGTGLSRNKMPDDAYTYTDVFFAIVDEKHVVYSCVERKKVCPLLEPGSKLTVEQVGNSIYIPNPGSSENKPSVAHYELVGGSW